MELYQAESGNRAAAHRMVDAVFDNPPGSVKQEIAGVFTTLSASASSRRIDLLTVALAECERIETLEVRDRVRQRQSEKKELESCNPGTPPGTTRRPDIGGVTRTAKERSEG